MAQCHRSDNAMKRKMKEEQTTFLGFQEMLSRMQKRKQEL